MKITVTGSAGFIGSHLVPALLMESYGVAAITEPGAAGLSGDPFTPADITLEDNLSRAFSGSDAVVHLAARNHILKETAKDPLAEYRRINVEGTRNVVRTASRSGAKIFVHLSSVKAMAERSDAVLDEYSPCAPATPYGISKLESEAVVREEAGRTGMRAVILRLPMVYGPRNRGNLPRMIRWADRGWPFPLFQPDNLRSMIYVENVVAGILAILKKAGEGVTTYILKDKEDCSTRTVYKSICREMDKKPVFIPVPSPLVRLGGMLSDDFRKITGSFRVSSAKAEREFGFVPPFSLEEGIARTVRWYKRSAH